MQALERIADAMHRGNDHAELMGALVDVKARLIRIEAALTGDPDELRKVLERIERIKQEVATGSAELTDAVDRNKPPA